MPGIYAHYKVGLRVVEADRRFNVYYSAQPGAARLGFQGPDFCFYYKPWNKQTRERFLGLSRAMHSIRTDSFFKAALTYAKEAPIAGRGAMRAYLLGFLCHYALDSIAHPYVYFHTYDSRQHLAFESYIDCLLMRKEGYDYVHPPFYDFIGKPDSRAREAIAGMLKHAVMGAHGAELKQSELTSALGSMHSVYRLLYDPHGKKLPLLERIADKRGLQDDLHALFYAREFCPEGDFLNEAHEEWSLSRNIEFKTSSSFLDLMDEAVNRGRMAVEAAARFFDSQLVLEAAMETIGDLNMLTGRPCSERAELNRAVSLRFFKPQG